jgi:hypothetical protein
MPPSAPTPSPPPPVSTTPRVVTHATQHATTTNSAQNIGWNNCNGNEDAEITNHFGEKTYLSPMAYNNTSHGNFYSDKSDNNNHQHSLSLPEVTSGGQDTGNNGILTQANNSTNVNDWMGTAGGMPLSPWTGSQLGVGVGGLYNSSLLGGVGAGAGLFGNSYYNNPLMGMGMMTGTTGPLASLTQAVYGVQQLIFAVTQAAQLCTAHATALSQMSTWLQGTCRDALHAYRVVHQQAWQSYRQALDTANRDPESNPQQLQRQRRLQALRWMTMTVVTYVGWTVVRRLVALLFRNRQPRLTGMPHPQPQWNAAAATLSYPPYAQSPPPIQPLYSAPAAAGQYHYPYYPTTAVASPDSSSLYSLPPPSYSYPTTAYPY